MQAVVAVLNDPRRCLGGPRLSAHTAVCVLQWGFSGSRVSRILLPLFSSYKTHPPPPPPYSIQPFAVSFHPPTHPLHNRYGMLPSLVTRPCVLQGKQGEITPLLLV